MGTAYGIRFSLASFLAKGLLLVPFLFLEYSGWIFIVGWILMQIAEYPVRVTVEDDAIVIQFKCSTSRISYSSIKDVRRVNEDENQCWGCSARISVCDQCKLVGGTSTDCGGPAVLITKHECSGNVLLELDNVDGFVQEVNMRRGAGGIQNVHQQYGAPTDVERGVTQATMQTITIVEQVAPPLQTPVQPSVGTRFDLMTGQPLAQPAQVAQAQVAQAQVAPSPPIMKQADPESTYPIGTKVMLKGLQARQDLNGKEGIVELFLPEKGRFRVRIAQETVDLKPENLLPFSLDAD
jgi:hypothetical protein